MTAEPLRVVLVASGLSAACRSLAATLTAIEEYGWVLVALVAPEHHLDALRMVVGGEADAIIATRPEHVPAVMFSGDLVPTGGGPRGERTRILPRAAEEPVYRTDRSRRPQPVR